MKNIHIGQKLYINGKAETEELIVNKIGRLYATFNNAPHRLILKKGIVELKKNSKWDKYVMAFPSAQEAKDWLKTRMREVFKSD